MQADGSSRLDDQRIVLELAQRSVQAADGNAGHFRKDVFGIKETAARVDMVLNDAEDLFPQNRALGIDLVVSGAQQPVGVHREQQSGKGACSIPQIKKLSP